MYSPDRASVHSCFAVIQESENGAMPHNHSALAGLTVLHVTQPVEGGVARVVTDLVRAQVRAGARVVVACPIREPGHPRRSPLPQWPDSLPRTAARAGAEVVRWDARRSPGPLLAREVGAARRLIRSVRPDLLHLHSAKAGLAGRLAARGSLPTVFQPHAWSYEAAGGLTSRAALGWERRAADWSDCLLCVSRTERAAGEARGIRGAWTVVPNGVDTSRFTPLGGGPEDAAERASLRAGLPGLTGAGTGAGAPLVVCVGRLCRQKGQDVLLRAWPGITARMPAARLVLVGDGPRRSRLRRQAPWGVVMAGAAADPAPWYRAADVVVLPSRWEGMALAPLEAMACGRPVVVTDAGGARECLPPADAAACVVPAEDARALAAALLRLLTDPALRVAAGARALAHVRERHDLRRSTAAVTALYRGLLGLSGPGLPEGAALR